MNLTEQLDTHSTCEESSQLDTMKVGDDLPTVSVIRRDLVGHECLVCDPGNYMESWGDNVVHCGFCGHVTRRYLTKREMFVEMARHALELLDHA